MKNILKRFAASDTNSRNSNFKLAVVRLTFYYTIGVFLIFSLFSFVLYAVLDYQLNQNIERFEAEHEEGSIYQELKENPLHELQENLFNIILIAEIIILLLIIVVSYYLSKKTLRPLEESYLKQKRFVSNASHELRTPLAVMKAGLETLLLKDREKQEYKNFSEDFLEEINRLVLLSSDLLALNGGDANQKSENVNLSEVLTKYITSVRAYADERQVSIKQNIERGVVLQGKESDFMQIFVNLISNAINYNRPNGEVSISLSSEKNSKVFSVKDTGIGIPAEKIDHIFEPFYKVDDSRSRHSGAGLGLSIVKEILNKYQAKIIVTSQIDVGTEVRITFSFI